MPISTNSIIHYTKKLDTLKMILKEGFKIKYCVESLIIENKAMHSCHPMISFCDIPLSESSKHFNAISSFLFNGCLKNVQSKQFFPVGFERFWDGIF